MFYIFITAVLFYFVAIMQISFFSHFDILGTTPNIIFITFAMLVFFDTQSKNNYYNTIIWAFCAGIFLDIFSYPYFGASIALLIAVGFLMKKIQSSLKEQQNRYPLSHLLIVFFSSFLVYRAVNVVLLNFNNLSLINPSFVLGLSLEVVYSGLIAVGIFFVLKKVMPLWNDRKKL